jgi:hypothetical protein
LEEIWNKTKQTLLLNFYGFNIKKMILVARKPTLVQNLRATVFNLIPASNELLQIISKNLRCTQRGERGKGEV